MHTLTDPLWIMTHSLHSLFICSTHDSSPYCTNPRHCGLPVYKSAIWVPCSPSSDLVTIPYTLCNNQLDSPCSSPVCDCPLIATSSILEPLRSLFIEYS